MKQFLFIFSFLFIALLQTPLFAQDKGQTAANVEESVVSEMSVVDNKLKVKNAPIGRRIEILSILGNKVKTIEIKSTNAEYDLNLPKAIYIFKLDGTVRKFFVK